MVIESARSADIIAPVISIVLLRVIGISELLVAEAGRGVRRPIPIRGRGREKMCRRRTNEHERWPTDPCGEPFIRYAIPSGERIEDLELAGTPTNDDKVSAREERDPRRAERDRPPLRVD